MFIAIDLNASKNSFLKNFMNIFICHHQAFCSLSPYIYMENSFELVSIYGMMKFLGSLGLNTCLHAYICL